VWIKLAGNPVIVPERGMNAMLFRDPTTMWLADNISLVATRGLSVALRTFMGALASSGLCE
jgi:hypothetical protein